MSRNERVRKVKGKVFVAMSGGVDSSVAAYLLQKQGYDVSGAFIRCYNIDGCQDTDQEDARRVAVHLGLPFFIFDFEEEYKKRVVDYMVDGYAKGETPNPDVMCNKEIKFGLFLQQARALGADYVATGHYARLKKTQNLTQGEVLAESRNDPIRSSRSRGSTGNLIPEIQVPTLTPDHPRPTTYALYQAKDKNKDQSYFLWTLAQNQLKHCLFPIGDYLKSEVREIARVAGLPTAAKKESQGICFLGKFSLGDFLRARIPVKIGDVLDEKGRMVGKHDGAWFYTVGQRHLGITDYESGIRGRDIKPHYVAGRDVKNNTVTVIEGANHPMLYKREIVLADVNFIGFSNIKRLKRNQKIFVSIRYHQKPQSARLCNLKLNTCHLVFEEPQKSVAVGQSAVFYSARGELLGGGVVTRT